MVYATEEKLKDLVPFHRDAYFIGGMLEACVSNFAIYWDKNHRTQNNNLFYIPELCVSQNVEARIRAEDILKERDILGRIFNAVLPH